ncbi:MAG TPA: hypothetical protein VMV95_03150 [Bacillota bacterium]|nr:hypothetical protein [Bacillota bacterium]
MIKENPVHIGLKYQEAFQTKRDILSLQVAILKIAKTIRGYGFYRSQELELKSELYKELKELKMSLGRLQKALPKPKIPDILKEDFGEKTEPKSKKIKPLERNLEEELQEIQNRLNDLQRKGV